MVWIIIALGVAFVIAPIFWIMPTPAQQRQARMRERARALGLEVISCELPQTRRQRVRGEERRRGMLYRARFARDAGAGDGIEPGVARWLRGPEGNWEQDDAAELPYWLTAAAMPAAAELPNSAVGYEISGVGIGLYWREGTDEAAVERVAAMLLRERDRLGAAG